MHQKSQSTIRPGIIFLAGLVVAFFGLIAIYDASVIDAYRTFSDRYHYLKQQSSWLLIGILFSLVTSRIPTGFLKKYSPHLLLVSILFLILVLIPGIGSKFLGARRWIVLGPVVFQPSELLKISLVLYLSQWLEKTRELKHFLMIIGFVSLLIMMQPDLGTAIIAVGTSFMLYYISGAKIKDLGIFSAVLVIAVMMLIVAEPYRLNRIKTFLDPTSDSLGKSYHINQILYGLGSGGLGGVGLGQSRQKYAFLPEATTDSIFVIIAEEFGFLGGAIVISTIAFLIASSLRVAASVSDKFDKLLASGVSLLFLIQSFVNLGSMVAIIPLTGVPLPFISYGGSSLVSNFIALGLLINVSRKK